MSEYCQKEGTRIMSDYTPSPQVIAWAKAHGYNAEAHVEFFNDYLANKTGKPYRCMDSAFRNCVRSDWGRIRYLMLKEGTYWPKRQEAKPTYQAPQPVEPTPEIAAKIAECRQILRRHA